MMNRKISLGVAIALMFITATVTLAVSLFAKMSDFNGRMKNLEERQQAFAKIEEIDRWVRSNFDGEIDQEELMDAIARGYISGLDDRYARYFTADEYTRLMADYDGKTADIGISTVQDPTGYIKVIEVYPESSAYTAGIIEGDLIVKVEDTDVNLNNTTETLTMLKGDAGTKVNIVVRRDNEDIPMEITRRQVVVPMVVTKTYGDNVGYMLIKEFNNNTPDQFSKALDKLIEQNVSAIIFDVRNNPGGTVASVSAMLDVLLPEGNIVTATYSDGSTETLAVSDASYIDLPIVVLTNARTASAAELFAQAIKDFGRGYTVGTTTYGKGVMQTIHQLRDGSALDITTAHFNPPSGVNFNGVGVKPDYEVTLTADQEKIYYELDEFSDPQLKKAIELATAFVKTGVVEPPAVDLDDLPEVEEETDSSSADDTDGDTTSSSASTDSSEENGESSSTSSKAAKLTDSALNAVATSGEKYYFIV